VSKSRIVALSSAPTLWSIAAEEWIASEISLLNLRFVAANRYWQIQYRPPTDHPPGLRPPC
jgi:hypothetical protein